MYIYSDEKINDMDDSAKELGEEKAVALTVGKRKRKEKKLVVLEDDEYVDRLGKIIRRDFYPDLHEIYKNSDPITAEEEKNVDKESLDKFQNKFTSEDNESFKVLHEKDKKEHRKKYWWAFDNDISDKRLLLTNGKQKYIEDAKEGLDRKRKQRNEKGLSHSATRFSEVNYPESGSVVSGVTQQTLPGHAIPMVNGYTFVTTPLDEPVSRPHSVTSQFSVTKRSSREEAAYRLTRMIEKKRKTKKLTEAERQQRNRMSVGATPRKRMLTPAAMSLAKKLSKSK